MMNTKNRRRAKTRKKTDLYISHQCSHSRNWMSNHYKYIVMQPREKLVRTGLGIFPKSDRLLVPKSRKYVVVYCLVCQDKKEHNIHDIMFHFMYSHYNQFIETVSDESKY